MRKLFITVFILAFYATVLAQQENFIRKEYISDQGDTLRYRELSPEKVVNGEKYPLVVFLHGAGERGSNNEAQLMHGANMFTNPVNREKYPAFVIFPQCPKEDFWAPRVHTRNFEGNPFSTEPEMSPALRAVKKVIDEAINNYPIDTNRIYIAGLSMGGMGTFDMLCRFPNFFAAAIPICGGVNIDRLNNIRTKTRIRIYHGDADSVVPVTFSREAYKTLKQNGSDVKYIEFPGVNHDSWTPAFNQPDFLAWLFEQKK